MKDKEARDEIKFQTGQLEELQLVVIDLLRALGVEPRPVALVMGGVRLQNRYNFEEVPRLVASRADFRALLDILDIDVIDTPPSCRKAVRRKKGRK
ncbi:hypothetical protein LCGC14_1098860 [marine sediment metagenome]|uniref:Uncharacterized protein n=1 Tax=marine sediment metagenome TaxID=412755 RepID=A0A0F9QG73_9ZZZZ